MSLPPSDAEKRQLAARQHDVIRRRHATPATPGSGRDATGEGIAVSALVCGLLSFILSPSVPLVLSTADGLLFVKLGCAVVAVVLGVLGRILAAEDDTRTRVESVWGAALGLIQLLLWVGSAVVAGAA